MQQQSFQYKKLSLAVQAAVLILSGISSSYAACTIGSAPSTDANTITCTEGSSFDNPSGTNVTNSAVISAGGVTSSVVKMDGNGNTFINAGDINNNATYAAGLSANAGQKFGVYIGAGTGTDEAALNDMTNSGNINAVIDINNVTNKARLNTAAVVGLGTDVEGEYALTNSGTITATHNGVGRVNGVEAGGDVEEMSIVNSGTIRGTHSSVITKTTSTATSFQGSTPIFGTAASIGVAAGIYAEEEVKFLEVENDADGLIEGVGTYASGIYTRSTSVIENAGTITGKTLAGTNTIGIAHVSDSGTLRTLTLENSGTINGDILSVNGVALRWWSLSNGEATTGNGIDTRLNINSQWGQADSNITNSGQINGDIYLSNGAHVLTNENGGVIDGNIDLDQRDTSFLAATTCNVGDTGNGCWDVAERPATTGVQAGNAVMSENVKVNVTAVTTTGGSLNNGVVTFIPSVVGAKTFTFENAGSFNGNLTIRTASSTLASGQSVVSNISLIPTITGSGSGSTSAAPSSNIAGLGNTLNLITTAGGSASNVTIKPKVATGVVVKDDEYFKVATTYQINSVTASEGSVDLPQIESASSLIEWTAEVNTSGNLVLVSELNTQNVAGITANANSALDTLFKFDSQLGSAIQNLETDEEIRNAAEQLLPEVNGASVQASMSASSKVVGLVESRVENAQVAMLTRDTGVATGEQAQNVGIWLQGFGFTGEQDKRNNVQGYGINGYGFAAGADTLIGSNEDVRVGGALAFSNASVDDQGARKANSTDIDSYQATIYAALQMPVWYLNGSLSIGQHQYDSQRLVLNNQVSASYEGMQYTAKLNAGKPFSNGKVTLVPTLSLAYSRLDIDSYSEKGKGALRVSRNEIDSFVTGLGGRAIIDLGSTEALKSNVEFHAIWNHEFADTERDSTARFTAGGASFSTNGLEIPRDSANVGVGLNLASAGKNIKQSLSVRYDAEIRSGYFNNTGLVEARFDF